MNSNLNKNFWEQKYINEETGWDLGTISTPIKEYANQLTNKELRILIPGAGNGYEAAYLHAQKFTNINVIDIAHQPLKNLKERVPSFSKSNLIHDDFFNHTNKYNLIIEQTFFCALHPTLRKRYVEKMASLLEKKGKLVGLLFDFNLTEEGPPFGGSSNEYLQLFSSDFSIKTLDRCHNSIKPRFGRELFFIFEKK